MEDEEVSYPINAVSKATHMIVTGVLTNPNNVKRLCDYHYNELIDGGATIISKSVIIEEFGSVECDICLKEKR
jgi:hypothetical protein